MRIEHSICGKRATCDFPRSTSRCGRCLEGSHDLACAEEAQAKLRNGRRDAVLPTGFTELPQVGFMLEAELALVPLFGLPKDHVFGLEDRLHGPGAH